MSIFQAFFALLLGLIGGIAVPANNDNLTPKPSPPLSQQSDSSNPRSPISEEAARQILTKAVAFQSVVGYFPTIEELATSHADVPEAKLDAIHL